MTCGKNKKTKPENYSASEIFDALDLQLKVGCDTDTAAVFAANDKVQIIKDTCLATASNKIEKLMNRIDVNMLYEAERFDCLKKKLPAMVFRKPCPTPCPTPRPTPHENQ